MPCIGNEILYFPWSVWLRAPSLLLSCCGGLSLSRWTKPNHGGELSVDLWDVWGRVVFPLQRSEGSGDRWKSRQREWILGHKCLPGFFSSLIPQAWWELRGSTSFSPLWKLNEKIREAQSTHFLYAKKSGGICVLKRKSFFSLFDYHLNVLASARSCSCHSVLQMSLWT